MALEMEAELFDAALVSPDELNRYDMIGFGSGIYFGRPHPSIRNLVSAMPALAKNVFLFSTSGLPFLRHVWHSGLKRVLLRKGYALVGEFNCRGWDTVGPLRWIGGLNRQHPNRHDLDRAVAFARSVSRSADRSDPKRIGAHQ